MPGSAQAVIILACVVGDKKDVLKYSYVENPFHLFVHFCAKFI